MMAVRRAAPGADLFDVGAAAVACPVNCVGVMGAGLAAEFRRRFPGCYGPYRDACERKWLEPGRVLTVTCGPVEVVHVPTKRHWREKSELVDVLASIRALAAEADVRGWKSLAVPALGCGLGGLEFENIRGPLEDAFAYTEIDVTIFLPRP